MVPSYQQISNTHILYDAVLLSEMDEAFFEAAAWRRRGAVIGGGEGRATALFVSHGDYRFVLRHYQRGGVLSHLVSDHYLWRGLEKTRAWREWHLLNQMYQEGLPVPRPVAARVQRDASLYRADLLTLFLPDCVSLAQCLTRRSMTEDLWGEVGCTVRRFHDAGYCHADLNAHNILIQGKKKLYLIDFDRGRRLAGQTAWKSANLKRLHRSVLKVTKHNALPAISDEIWQACLGGYHRATPLGA